MGWWVGLDGFTIISDFRATLGNGETVKKTEIEYMCNSFRTLAKGVGADGVARLGVFLHNISKKMFSYPDLSNHFVCVWAFPMLLYSTVGQCHNSCPHRGLHSSWRQRPKQKHTLNKTNGGAPHR